jgi:hypothetical protein
MAFSSFGCCPLDETSDRLSQYRFWLAQKQSMMRYSLGVHVQAFGSVFPEKGKSYFDSVFGGVDSSVSMDRRGIFCTIVVRFQRSRIIIVFSSYPNPWRTARRMILGSPGEYQCYSVDRASRDGIKFCAFSRPLCEGINL